MKEKIIYVCNDSTRFDKKEDAISYEQLCDKVNNVISILGKKPKLENSVNSFIYHNTDDLIKAKNDFLSICYEFIPKYGRHYPLNNLEYFYGIMDKPILGITISRFLSIDFETGREYLNSGCLGEARINN